GWAVSGFMDGHRTIRIGRYKLAQRTYQYTSLFDLEGDPREQSDRATAEPVATRTLRGMLGLALAGVLAGPGSASTARPQHAPEQTHIDPETDAQLRALGYVGGSRPD